MKVLMATMQLDIGGAETHIVELSKALKKQGVDVYVASRGGAYEKELIDAHIPHFYVPLNSKSPSSMLSSYKILKKLIKEYKFDIVHAHARIPAFILGQLRKKMNFRFCTTAHWVFSTRFPFNLLTNWGQRSLAVSDDIKDYLIKNYGIDDGNIRVTINGIDTDKFSKDTDYSDIKSEFNLSDEKTRIVYVSRMDVDRSYAAHKLIEIAPELYRKIEKLEILIVGGGNDYDQIKKEAEDACEKVGKAFIITTGSRIDINKFTASADIFIGVSRAALEAMAAEKPAIIAGNEGYIGIFDESKLKVSIDTNFCCRGCEETTAQRLKEDILSLLDNKDEAKLSHLGKYSRETVKKYYSVDTMANDALKMYCSVITGKRINSVTPEDIENAEKNISAFAEGKNIVISGYYGFHNSGDDSILSGILSNLRSICSGANITVLSKNPDETAKEYDVNSIKRTNIIKIIFSLIKADLFISGGGSLLQDITSSKSLTYYTAMIRLAKICGAKTYIYANGIGPVTKKSNKKTVRNVLNNVDAITLRETDSETELHNMGVTTPIKITADPVFSLSPENKALTKAYLKKKGLLENEKYFVLSVRDWNTKNASFEKYVADFINAFSSKYNLIPVIVAMQPEKDHLISEKILKRLSGKCIFINESIRYDRHLGILDDSQLCIAMRLHTLIYAAKTSTPSIGIVYDPKVSSMLKYTNQGYTIDISDVTCEKLFDAAETIINNKDMLSKQLKMRSEELTELEKENAKIAAELLK